MKQQSSLYCTVRYHCNKETEKPSYSYYYHISDDLTHDDLTHDLTHDKAIVIEDFFYSTAKQSFDYLSENLSCES